MTKTNPNIDYSRAMDDLFKGLKMAEEKVKEDDPYKYANAYGRAAMAIKMCLITCTDMTFQDIDKELNPDPDDLPKELFTQPNTNQI